MNKLIIKNKKTRANENNEKKKFGLEMALAKLATVRNTLSINQLLEHKKRKKTNEKRRRNTSLAYGSGVTKLLGTSPFGAQGKVMHNTAKRKKDWYEALLWPYGMRVSFARHLPQEI